MRLIQSVLPILTLLASCAAGAPLSVSTPLVASEASLVITNVSVIDPESGTASGPRDVFVGGSRIIAVSAAGERPIASGTPRLDGTGRFAAPGLIDVHAHVGDGGASPGTEMMRERALRQFLHYGVTTIFVPGATGAGDRDLPALKQRCRSNVGLCPGIFGSASLITAPGSHPVSTIFRMPLDVSADVTEARGVTVLRPGADVSALVDTKLAAGADALKIIIEDGPPPWYPRPRLTDEQVRAIVVAAHARSVPVFAHISTAEQVRVALDAGVDGIMHAPTDALPDELLRRMADQHMWYVPTFSLYDGILTWARKQREADPYALMGVDPAAIESLASPAFLAASAEDEAGALAYLANASGNLRRAASAGVRIALGSDVNNPFVFPGFSTHEELALMVRAGLTPAQALRTATLGGAAFLARAESLGRIAPGFEADLILLARNPLERIENSRSIVEVIADGHIVPDSVGLE